jgi:hypothetical protein
MRDVMRDDGLRRLLEALPREAAPPIAVESLLRRLLWRKIALLATLVLLLGGTTAGFLLRRGEEPPVNLQIRVVDPGDAVEQPTQGPPELNLP